jgi:AcrR family transcriptional regulator
MRADAARNRGRLLEAAAAAFAEQGLDVPVAEIARRAGVGPGTLFRHFASKDDLIVAIVEQRLEEVQALARQANEHDDPWAGLVEFMTAAGELQAADRGLIDAIRPRVLENPALHACRGELFDILGELLERGQAAGAVRDDLAAGDLAFLVNAVARAGDAFPGADPRIWRRYLAIVIDGLRAGATTPLLFAPPQLTPPPPAEAAPARTR